MGHLFCRFFVSVVIALVVVIGTSAQDVGRIHSSPKKGAGNQDREYQVLTAIVAKYYKDSGGPIVVDEFLQPCPDSSHFQGDTTKLIEPLTLAKMNNDCLLGGRRSLDIKRFKSKHRFKLIRDGEYGTYFKDRDCEYGWADFYSRYPKSQGYVSFSRVGFDESGEFAYLQFVYVAGCLNGEGHLFIMQKVDEKWQVAADSQLWVM